MDDRLIVALDYDLSRSEEIVARLGDSVGFYKLGLSILSARGGVEFAHRLRNQGKKVFQDWKLHDIGAQVHGAVHTISLGGCDLLTVHGEPQVMEAAVASRTGDTKIVAVTVLTTLDVNDLTRIGYADPYSLVVRRVQQAIEAGVDGVVASVKEAANIKLFSPPGFLIVVPGIRPVGSSHNDQKRVGTPGEAIAAGATHIVVGRPITEADDPSAAVAAILGEM